MDSRKRSLSATMNSLPPPPLQQPSAPSSTISGDVNRKDMKLNLDPNAGGPSSVVHLKMLVPSVAAGAIIGKGGETIADLQKSSGARVKMSKANDYYPGTNERVCLVSGCPESVLMVVDFMGEKIREKPDPNGRSAIDFDNRVSAEREKQLKIIIPNSTAGMVIGKAGAFIKQVKDESGCFIQISQKSKDTTLPERVVTVIGDRSSSKKAMTMIIAKVQEDPQSASCLNISYSECQGLVANFNPTGSPFAQQNGGQNEQQQQQQQQLFQQQPGNHTSSRNSLVNSPSPFVLPLQGGGSLNLKFNMNVGRAPTDPALMAQYIQHIGATLRTSGYTDVATEEITRAITCLASHGILVINLMTDPNPTTDRVQQQPAQQQQQQQQQPPNLSNGELLNHRGYRPGNHAPAAGAAAAATTTFSGMEAHNFGLALAAAAAATANHADHGSYSRYWTGDPPAHLTVAPAAAIPMETNASPGGRPVSPQQQSQPPPPPQTQFMFSTVQQQQQPQPQQMTSNKNSFGLATGKASSNEEAKKDSQQQQIDLEVNESIIGAVIGPSGRSILDMQQCSGARIQVSKKGTFSPGTRNRIVTISGPQKAISAAKFLIEKKIQEEESKRERSAY